MQAIYAALGWAALYVFCISVAACRFRAFAPDPGSADNNAGLLSFFVLLRLSLYLDVTSRTETYQYV
jgi:hypothetical protein